MFRTLETHRTAFALVRKSGPLPCIGIRIGLIDLEKADDLAGCSRYRVIFLLANRLRAK